MDEPDENAEREATMEFVAENITVVERDLLEWFANALMEDLETHRSAAAEAEERLGDLTSVQQEKDTISERLESANEKLQEQEQVLNDERARREEATTKASSLEREVQRLRSDLAREKQHLENELSRSQREQRTKAASSRELDRAARENMQMRDEMRGLADEVEVQRAAVAEMQALLSDRSTMMEEMESTLRTQEDTIEALRSEQQEMQDTVEQVRQEREETLAGAEREREQHAKETHQLEEQMHGLRRKIAEKDRQLSELRQEIDKLKNETRVTELENTIEELELDLQSCTGERDALYDEVNQQRETISSLGQRLDSQHRHSQEMVDDAVQKERKRWETAAKEMEQLQDRLHEERKRTAATEKELGECQKQLDEARHRMQQYEREFGIEDAVREIDSLRDQLNTVRTELDGASNNVADQRSQFETLLVIAKRLAKEANYSDEEAEDVLHLFEEQELRIEYASSLDRVRQDNEFLSKRVEELEANRIELLRELRVNAQQVGKDSLRFFGLSGDDMLLVNRFAENLRSGEIRLPERDESASLRRQVEALQRQLSEERGRSARLAAQFADQHAQGLLPDRSHTHSFARGRETAVVAQESEDAKRDRAALRDEIAHLRGAIDGMKQGQADKIRELEGALAREREARQEEARQQREAREKAAAAATESLSEDMNEAIQQVLAQLETAARPDTHGLDRDAAQRAYEAVRELKTHHDDISSKLQEELENSRDLASQLESKERELAAEKSRVDELRRHYREEYERREREERERREREARDRRERETRLSESEAGARISSDELVQALRSAVSELRSGASPAAAEPEVAPQTPEPPGHRGRRPTVPAGDTLPWAPFSPQGKRAVQKLRSGKDVGSEEEAQELAVTEAALVRAMEEVLDGETTLQQLTRALDGYESTLATAASQQACLYASYAKEKMEWEQRQKAGQRRIGDLEAQVEALQRKSARLSELHPQEQMSQQVADADADTIARATQLQDRVQSLTLDLASLEEEVPLLRRRVNLAEDEALQAQEGKTRAEHGTIEVEAALRHRVLYLELWKQGAEARLERFTEVAETWVPQAQWDSTRSTLERLRERHLALLAEDASLRADVASLRESRRHAADAEEANRLLSLELKSVRANCDAYRRENERLHEQLRGERSEEAPGQGSRPAGGGPSSSSRASLAHWTRGELESGIVRLESEVATHKVEAGRAQASVTVLQERLQRMRAELDEVRRESEDAERRAKEARNLAEREADDRDAVERKFAGGLEAEAADALRQELREAKDAVASTELRARRAEEVADIATSQVAGTHALRRQNKAEIDDLRTSLREQASRDDDAAIIGRLQARLLSLKSAFANLWRRHESAQRQLTHSRATEAALHVSLDATSAKALRSREDMRVQQLALVSEIGRLQEERRAWSWLQGMRQGGGATAAAAVPGGLQDVSGGGDHQPSTDGDASSPMSILERLQSTIARLSKESEDRADAIAAESSARRSAESRAAEAELDAASMRDEMADVRRALKGTDDADRRATGRRLLELNQRLRVARKRELRAQREAAEASARAERMAAKEESLSSSVHRLEEELVDVEHQLSERQEECRRLRAELGRLRAERDALRPSSAADDYAAASTALQAARGDPGTGKGVPTPEEQASRTLRSYAVSQGAADDAAQSQRRIRLVERQKSAARERAKAAEMLADRRARRIAFLEHELEALGVDRAELAEAERTAGEQESESDAQLENSLRQAAETERKLEDESDHTQRDGAQRADVQPTRDVAPSPRPASGPEAGGIERNGRSAAKWMSQEEWQREREELQAAARKTINALRSLVDRKTGLVEELKRRLAVLREERDAEREADVAARERMADEWHSTTATTMQQLREGLGGGGGGGGGSAMGAPRPGLGAGGGGSATQTWQQQLQARNEALEREFQGYERALAERDAHINALRSQLHATEERVTSAEQAAHEAKQELESLQSDGNRMQLERLVRTLRGQLDRKQQKIQTLQQTLASLKEEFVRAEEEHAAAQAAAESAQRSAARERGRAAQGQAADEDVRRLKARVASLQKRVASTKQEADRALEEKANADAAKATVDQQRQALQAEVTSLRAAQERANAETKRLASALEQEKQARAAAVRVDSQRLAESRHMGSDAEQVRQLERRIQVLEAQNAALRSANDELATQRRRVTGGMPASGSSSGGGGATKSAAAEPGEGPSGGGSTARADAPGAKTHAQWEQEKKLRRRVETLSRRLKERADALDAAEKAQRAAESRCEALEKERTQWERRYRSMEKQKSAVESSVKQALADIEPVEQLRGQLLEAEEECAEWKRRCEGELATEIRRARAEAETAQRRSEAAEAEARDVRNRLRSLHALLGVGAEATHEEAERAAAAESSGSQGLDPAARLRASEDRFLAETALRDQLAAARREAASLEGTLMTRDAELVDSRMEVEAKELEVERLRRRLRELDGWRSLQRAAGADFSAKEAKLDETVPGVGRLRPAGEARGAQRDAEWEAVVLSLRHLVESQREELKRLRAERGRVHASATATARWEEERKRLKTALSEQKRAKDASEEARRKAEADVRDARAEVQRAKAEWKRERDRLSAEAAAAGGGGSHSPVRAEEERKESRDPGPSGSRTPDERWERERRRLQRDKDALQEQLQEKESEIEKLQEQHTTLREENAALREELSAFDLEFFEELEDLKFRYAAAARKCAAFDAFLEQRGLPPYEGGRGDAAGQARRSRGEGVGEGKDPE